jgi:hypothetical protein
MSIDVTLHHLLFSRYETDRTRNRSRGVHRISSGDVLQVKGWNIIGGCLLHGSDSFPKLPKVRCVPCDLCTGQRVIEVCKDVELRATK